MPTSLCIWGFMHPLTFEFGSTEGISKGANYPAYSLIFHLFCNQSYFLNIDKECSVQKTELMVDQNG